MPQTVERPIYIAERTITSVAPDGVEGTIIIRIGKPYQCTTGEWACPIALDGLYPNLRDQHGEDSFQALLLAQNLARSLLNDFLEKGGVLLDEPKGNQIAIERLFSIGVYY